MSNSFVHLSSFFQLKFFIKLHSILLLDWHVDCHAMSTISLVSAKPWFETCDITSTILEPCGSLSWCWDRCLCEPARSNICGVSIELCSLSVVVVVLMACILCTESETRHKSLHG